MEGFQGSQGARHLQRLKYPSWNRSSLYLQANFSLLLSCVISSGRLLIFNERALMFIIITTHFQWAASKRDETISLDSLDPWDKAVKKIQGQCLEFRPENSSTYFYYWPEDDPDAHFDHCCATDKDRLYQYKYGIHGPKLVLGCYYDLGLIDQCMPYWKCYHLFQSYFQTNIYVAYCEITDLRNLYKRRFVVRTVLKHGLLESAIPLIVSLEILVLFFVSLYWCIWRRPVNGSRSIVKDASRDWLRHIRKTLVIDWTHLCLLSIVGNGLVEAVGHQSPYSSQSKAFYNYARLYVVLSILVWYSSVLQQVAYAIAEIEMCYMAAAQETAGRNQAATVPNTDPPATSPPLLSLSRQPSVISALEKTLGLNDDWKWQPIAAQAGILFCLWGFLTYSSLEDDPTVGAVFGIIVSAACPWSGLYALKVIIHAIKWLLRRVYNNIFGRNYRVLWRSVLRLHRPLHRWRGRARQGDSTEFTELVSNEPQV